MMRIMRITPEAVNELQAHSERAAELRHAIYVVTNPPHSAFGDRTVIDVCGCRLNVPRATAAALLQHALDEALNTLREQGIELAE
jgi:hypothetical protein